MKSLDYLREMELTIYAKRANRLAKCYAAAGSYHNKSRRLGVWGWSPTENGVRFLPSCQYSYSTTVMQLTLNQWIEGPNPSGSTKCACNSAVEYVTFNLGVEGSIPSRRTINGGVPKWWRGRFAKPLVPQGSESSNLSSSAKHRRLGELVYSTCLENKSTMSTIRSNRIPSAKRRAVIIGSRAVLKTVGDYISSGFESLALRHKIMYNINV